MQFPTLNEAYSIYNELTLEDKEYFLGLATKQIIEDRRNAILKEPKKQK